jgi:uncharacterized protein (DUF983 family)
MANQHIPAQRDVKGALVRGLLCRCPSCGEAPLFERGLKPVDRCPVCHEDMTAQRADDFPAYLVILILGHLLVPVMVSVNMVWDLPMAGQMIAWPLLGLLLAVLMIRPAKGGVIAVQWAMRMGDFKKAA